jgi:hypothetical protein
MPYPEGDGEFISTDFYDILAGVERDCDKRLEAFREKANE